MPNKVNAFGFLISVKICTFVLLLNTKIYKPHGWKAPQGQHLFTLKRFLILKVLKTSLITSEAQRIYVYP